MSPAVNTPPDTSAWISVQRRSASTVRPSGTEVPSRMALTNARSPGAVAPAVNALTYASWWSEPGAAEPIRPRRAADSSARPVSRQAGSAYCCAARRAWRITVCSTVMSVTEWMPEVTSRT